MGSASYKPNLPFSQGIWSKERKKCLCCCCCCTELVQGTPHQLSATTTTTQTFISFLTLVSQHGRYERSRYRQNKECWLFHWLLPLSSIFKLFWNQQRQAGEGRRILRQGEISSYEESDLLAVVILCHIYRVSQKKCLFCQVLSFWPWERCF